MTRTAQTVAILGLLIAADQLSKFWVASNAPSWVVFNPGWIGGSFSQISVVFRSGLVVGYFLGVLVLLISFWDLWTDRLFRFHYPVLLFFAGITGNFIDKIRLGAVIDFIPIHFSGLRAVMNSADLYQWIGLGFLFYALVMDRGDALKSERRKQVFTDRRLQLKLFAQVSTVLVSLLAAMNLLVSIALPDLDRTAAQELRMAILWTSVCYGFLFETILFLIILRETQKWIGPVRAFIRYMSNPGQKDGLKLRSNDEFKDLEHVANARN